MRVLAVLLSATSLYAQYKPVAYQFNDPVSSEVFLGRDDDGVNAFRYAAKRLALKSNGNVILAADLKIGPSSTFPYPNSLADALIAEFDVKSRKLLWSRPISGPGADSVTALAIAPNGDTVACGTSERTGPATTAGAFQTRTDNGGAWVVRLSNIGEIRFLTHFGDGNVTCTGIGVDPQNTVWFAGTGATLPGILGSLPTPPGYVARLDASGERLLGGRRFPVDVARMVLDTNGLPLLVGRANPDAFTTSAGAWITEPPRDPTFGSFAILKLRPDLSTVWASYTAALGAYDLAIDNQNHVYVAGSDGFDLLESSGTAGTSSDRLPRLPGSARIAVSPEGQVYLTGDTLPDVRSLDVRQSVWGLTWCTLGPARPFAIFQGTTLKRAGMLPVSARWDNAAIAFGHALVVAGQPFGAPLDAASTFLGRYPSLYVAELAPDRLELPGTNAACISHGGTLQASEVSPGLLASVFGDQLGPETGIAATPDQGRLPLALAGTSITIDGLPAPLLYASSTQVNYVVPWELNCADPCNKPVEVCVRSDQGQSCTSTRFAQRVPGPFLRFEDGTPLILNDDGSYNTLANPAKPGSFVTAYYTGLGRIAEPATGAIAGDPAPALITTALSGTFTYPGQRYQERPNGPVFERPRIPGAAVEITAIPGTVQGVWRVRFQIPALAKADFPFAERIEGYELAIQPGAISLQIPVHATR